MRTSWRPLLTLSVAVAILVVAVVLAVQSPQPPIWTLRVLLGVNDQKPTDWSGKVEAVGGDVVAIDGWHFEEKDKILGTSGWQCRTHDYVAFGQRAPVQLANGKPRVKEQKQPWPNGVTITVKGNAPTLKLKLRQGEVTAEASRLLIGQPLRALGGRVLVERMPETVAVRPAAKPPTEGAVQDDYPAFWVHYKSGKQYLAWLAYHKGKDLVLLAERDGPDGPWSDPKEVSGAGYHFRVALATTHEIGRAHV